MHNSSITIGSQGVYTLLIQISSSKNIKVGRLGLYNFPAGYYAYTGSALGVGAQGLLKRIGRHLVKGKKSRWHIDYFLKDPDVAIAGIIVSETRERRECMVAGALKKHPGVSVLVKRFGASDCRGGCGSHLHYLPHTNFKEALNLVLEAHKKVYLNPYPAYLNHP